MSRVFASQSFSAEEIEALDQLLRALRSNSDLSIIRRSKTFNTISQKVEVMRRRVAHLKSGGADAAKPETVSAATVRAAQAGPQSVPGEPDPHAF